MRCFILDDEVHSYRYGIIEALKAHELTIATSCIDGVQKYNGVYDLLLLDHDMRGVLHDIDSANTGFSFCKWLVNQFPRKAFAGPTVVLHSQSDVGRARMRDVLKKEKYRVVEYPFSSQYVSWLRERYGKEKI